MENYGLIIRHLRTLAGLSVRETAHKIGKSIGWLSEIENGSGTARLTEEEFDRIVELLDGKRHRPMFRTWVAAAKKHEAVVKPFDGAVLKFYRHRKGLSLERAGRLMKMSAARLSRYETGIKAVPYELRNRIMQAYGYNPASFKNMNSDPVRSKAVPIRYKLKILLNDLLEAQVEEVFQFALQFLNHESTNPTSET